MTNKRILFASIGVLIVCAIGISFFGINKKSEQTENPAKIIQHKQQKTKVKKQFDNKTQEINKYVLHVSNTNIPFITMFDISKLPKEEQDKADKVVSKYNDSYITKFNKDTHTFLVITPIQIGNRNVFDRHNLEILDVDLNDNGIHTKTIGFSGLDGETANAVEGFVTENETWDFDRTTDVAKPLKHTVLNPDGRIEYEETWNYDEKEPIKYEMKNGEGRTISVLKETFTGTSEYDKEHIFYDDDGQTELLVSVHYDGANITRFKYYNANDKDNSFSTVSEYSDGTKITEKIYDADYVNEGTLNAKYTNGKITSLELTDNNQQKEVIKQESCGQ